MLQVAGWVVVRSPRNTNISLQQKSIHNPAYPSTAVTSSPGPGPSEVSEAGNFGGIGGRVCKILHVNFRELFF
jgi:hypothetical protein